MTFLKRTDRVRLFSFCDDCLIAIDRSGTWETSLVENYREFHEQCGIAFGVSTSTTTLGKTNIRSREIRQIAHFDNEQILRDVLISENGVSLTNVFEIGKRRVCVYPDGSVSTIVSRWDADVWVDADELNLMETRRWLEKGFLIVARTVSKKDGGCCTCTSYFEPFSNAKMRSQRRSGMKKRFDSMIDLAKMNRNNNRSNNNNNNIMIENYNNNSVDDDDDDMISQINSDNTTNIMMENDYEDDDNLSSMDSRIDKREKNYYSDDTSIEENFYTRNNNDDSDDDNENNEDYDDTVTEKTTRTDAHTHKTGTSGQTNYTQYIFGFFQMPDFSSFGLSLPTFDELFGNSKRTNDDDNTENGGEDGGNKTPGSGNGSNYNNNKLFGNSESFMETAKAFNLPYTAECLGSFKCALSSADGILRVFREPFCACFDGGEGKRWFAHAGDFQALQINGEHEILVKWVTAQSLAQQKEKSEKVGKKSNRKDKNSNAAGTTATAVRFQNFGEFRDQAFDCIVSMLEEAPGLEANEDQHIDTEDNESIHGLRPECDRNAVAAMRVGYHPERFVFVEIESLFLDDRMRERIGKRSKPVINISVGQHASSARATRLGYNIDTILNGGDLNDGSDFGVQKFEVEKFFAFPAADVDCNAGRIAVVITVPILKHGEEDNIYNDENGENETITTYATLALGEASIPLAILETNARSAQTLTANLSVVKNIEATLQDVNPKPATKNGAKGVGSIRCRAWLGTRSEAIEAGASNIRPETIKRGKSKDFRKDSAKDLHMALHNIDEDDGDSSDDEKAAVLFGEGTINQKNASARPIVRVAPRTCKVYVRISSVRGIPEAEAGKNSNGVLLRCSLLNDSRDLGIFKAKKFGQPATRVFESTSEAKKGDKNCTAFHEDHDVICFEVEEPIVNAIVKIDVYSNHEGGAKNVKIGRFCIDCSGMPKTICKDSRSSIFRINQRTGVPLALGQGKFKLLRSPKNQKTKAIINVDANGEFSFAGKTKVKPLSTLSGFTQTTATTTKTTKNGYAENSDSLVHANETEYLGEVKIATRIVRSTDPLAASIVGAARIRVLKMRHVPSGSAPGIALRHDVSWVWLPNASARSPAGWKREVDVAIRDITKPVHIGVFDRARADERIGVCTIYPSSLPLYGRDIVATVPLRSEDNSEVTGEITIKASFRKVKAGNALRRSLNTDSVLSPAPFGGLEDSSMSVGYVSRAKQLARAFLFGRSDMDDDLLVRDPSFTFAGLSSKFGGGNDRHAREEREKREAQRLALIVGSNKLPSSIVDALMFENVTSSAAPKPDSSFVAADGTGERERKGAKIGTFASATRTPFFSSITFDKDGSVTQDEDIDAIRAKAAVIRISLALQPFAYVLKRIERATRWRDYVSSASLHLVLLFFCFFPNYIVASLCLGFVFHCSTSKHGMSWCLFGAEKSRNVEILRVDTASEFTNFPPGSKFDAPIGWFSTVVRGTEIEDEGLLRDPKQVNDAMFDATMQAIFWVQCQISYLADFMESLRKETLRWEHRNYKNCMAAIIFATSIGAITVFIPFGFVVSSLLFYSLRPGRLAVPKFSVVKLKLNSSSQQQTASVV